MTLTLDPEYFAAWRKKKSPKLTQRALADILGVSKYTVIKWETKKRALPPYIGLAMAAIDAGLEPVGKDHMIEAVLDKE
ncbi:helix-turn-helix domain-containing protein [Ensifer aridi]|uniref:helix-turn-helix domain-containing protein n=1 Tax=Ensifer aridi TaxID=1708715 RepID=UPI000A121C0C|nr:helix-turn-helix transcriptional regulator [Ensifer aridi]